jgi:hypothetical protein
MGPRKSLPILLLAAAVVVGTGWPAAAQGQRARPRSAPTVGTAVPRSHASPPYRPGYGQRYYRPYYYRPYYYRPYYYWPSYYWPSYYWPYYWPYYGTSFGFSVGFGYPGYYYGGAYPLYYGGGAQSLGGIRFLVEPKNAEVYVDGFYAGIVDNFDGTFQKLSLPPGEHKIELYLDGYRTVHQTLYLQPDSTLKVSYKMEPLAPGETNEPRPTPPPEARAPEPAAGPASPPPAVAPVSPTPATGIQVQPGTFGTLSVRVQPADAEILVDGEAWHAPAEHDRLVLEISAGRHRVEVRKEGYETFTADVEIRAGETTPLNVSILQRQPV